MRTMAEGAAEPMLATASLGELLAADRATVGLELDELSRASGLEPAQIAAVEAGRHDLTDHQLCELLDRYAALATARASSSRRPLRALVEIDLDAGSLRLRRTRRRRTVPAADRNLLHYLSMVHRHNGLAVGTEVPLKVADLDLLRASLALRRDDVASRVDRMTGRPGPRLAPGRSLLVAAVVSGAVVAAGAIILIPSSGSSGQPDPSPDAIDPRIDIGTPLVIERSPSEIPGFGTDLAPATEADVDAGVGAESGADPSSDVETGASTAGIFVPGPGASTVTDRPANQSEPRVVDVDDNAPRGPPIGQPMIS